MRNDERRSSANQSLGRFQNGGFCIDIYRARRLVEDDDRGVLQKSSCKSDSLTFSARKR